MKPILFVVLMFVSTISGCYKQPVVEIPPNEKFRTAWHETSWQGTKILYETVPRSKGDVEYSTYVYRNGHWNGRFYVESSTLFVEQSNDDR